jgi:hypothetical protein
MDHMRIGMDLLQPKKGVPPLKTLSQVLAPNKKKNEGKVRHFRKERKGETLWERICNLHKQQPLFRKKDLRGTLGHQISTLNGMRTRFSHRLGFLSIVWQGRGRLGGVGVR